MTTGCLGPDGQVACNRPFGNCLPDDKQWNYPYPPNEEELALIRENIFKIEALKIQSRKHEIGKHENLPCFFVILPFRVFVIYCISFLSKKPFDNLILRRNIKKVSRRAVSSVGRAADF